MKKILAIISFILGLLVGTFALGPFTYSYMVRQKALKKKALEPSQIVAKLRESADLVTTEVTVRKLGLYDSKESEPLSLTSPASWKLGQRLCVIPVEVTLKYGFNMLGLTQKDIKISIANKEIEVSLPPPELIDHGYGLALSKEAMCAGSPLASEVGHELKEKVRFAAYEAVLKENILAEVGGEVRRNGQLFFESLLKSLGYERVSVVVR